MNSMRAIFFAALMAIGFGGIVQADGCCGSGCGTSSTSDCCCGCELTCCEDCDCTCGSSTTSTSCNSCNDFCGGCAQAKDMLLPFSQGENTARRYAGVAHLQNLPDQEDWNWHLDAALEYQQNWDRGLLGTYFFPNGTNRILVGQDRALGGSADVRGSDLGLSQTFSGILTICPKIQNVIFEPTIYIGLDRWVEGLWVDLSIPVAYTKWGIRACETDFALGGTLAQPFVTPVTVPLGLNDTYTLAQLSRQNGGITGSLGTIPTASTPADVGVASAISPKTICQAFGGVATWGDKTTPLQAGRILCTCDAAQTAVADLPFQIGYNLVNKDRGYLGVYLRTVFPTGNMRNQRSIFDPTVGYGRWQVGGGLQFAGKFYEYSEESSASIFANVYATHIFAKRQCRLFDIVGRGAWSRYLLMKEADANGNYTGRLFNFADIFTACVKSKFDWQVDGLLFLNFKHKGWTWDIGWEIKARACEKFDCDCIELCNQDREDNRDCEDESCDCSQITNKIGSRQYGVKGPQIIGAIGTAVFDAYDTTINTFGKAAIPNVSGSGAQIDSLVSPTAVLINANNFTNYLDFNRTRIPRAIANKIWSHWGYTWANRDYPVAAGLGFEVDFGQSNRQPRFWGIWGKVTVAYN